MTAPFDRAELLKQIALAVRHARAYRITSGEGTVQYVGLALAAGPAFHEDPKVRQFLTLPNRDPEKLIHHLVERVSRRLEGR